MTAWLLFLSSSAPSNLLLSFIFAWIYSFINIHPVYMSNTHTHIRSLTAYIGKRNIAFLITPHTRFIGSRYYCYRNGFQVIYFGLCGYFSVYNIGISSAGSYITARVAMLVENHRVKSAFPSIPWIWSPGN